MQKDILYLGSQSRTRRRLLELAQIEHKILQHSSDEALEYGGTTFEQYVLAIATHKMHTLLLPDRSRVNSDYLYALTADTLIKNTKDDTIFGKPQNREHAIEMLTAERQAPVEVVTGCCLEKFYFSNSKWERKESAHWTTGAIVEFLVDDDAIEQYLSTFSFVLECSGAGVIEDHGLSYLKSIQGSYTAVLGLPLYELRQALKKMDFRF